MKTLFFSLLALVALVALPETAAAQGGGGGSGTVSKLRARGVGTVHFQGAGKFEFRLDKSGVLVVENAASLQIALVGIGKSKINAAGELVVTDFKGRVHVSGQGVKGKFLKGRLGMRAVGGGVASFIGKGKIVVDGTPAGKWSPPPGTPISW